MFVTLVPRNRGDGGCLGGIVGAYVLEGRKKGGSDQRHSRHGARFLRSSSRWRLALQAGRDGALALGWCTTGITRRGSSAGSGGQRVVLHASRGGALVSRGGVWPPGLRGEAPTRALRAAGSALGGALVGEGVKRVGDLFKRAWNF